MDLRSGHFALPAVAMMTTFAAVVLAVLMVLVVLMALVLPSLALPSLVAVALVPDSLLAPDHLLAPDYLLALLVVLLVAEAAARSPRSSAVAVSIFVGSGGSAGHLR